MAIEQEKVTQANLLLLGLITNGALGGVQGSQPFG
jgi:hypothetical protein